MDDRDFNERIERIDDHIQFQYEKIKEIRDSKKEFNFGYAFDLITLDYKMNLGRACIEFERYEEARTHFAHAYEQTMRMRDNKKRSINLKRMENELRKIYFRLPAALKSQHS